MNVRLLFFGSSVAMVHLAVLGVLLFCMKGSHAVTLPTSDGSTYASVPAGPPGGVAPADRGHDLSTGGGALPPVPMPAPRPASPKAPEPLVPVAPPVPGPSALPAPPHPAPIAADAGDGPKVHVVQAGDNLTRIAKKYGVGVDELLAANSIAKKDMNRIQLGEKLKIPSKN